jgi:hypothetical protein
MYGVVCSLRAGIKAYWGETGSLGPPAFSSMQIDFFGGGIGMLVPLACSRRHSGLYYGRDWNIGTWLL